jgi:hypothetical protein
MSKRALHIVIILLVLTIISQQYLIGGYESMVDELNWSIDGLLDVIQNIKRC